eukprot:561187-Rhodomonas_salina.1
MLQPATTTADCGIGPDPDATMACCQCCPITGRCRGLWSRTCKGASAQRISEQLEAGEAAPGRGVFALALTKTDSELE